MPHSTIARLFLVEGVDLIHVDVDGDTGVLLADTMKRASLLPRCRSCNGRIAPGSPVSDWEGGGRTIKHMTCPSSPVYIHRASDENWPDDN